eukprot:CAMPEP_0202777500 /NCGR_PEP_ID=MMETSP1388-20130828/52824_1 /ASSEMBLY_ACC=CAM_ASM_000864 /TAXON_ID=37098 /ORGANISM="Isochrysis sp, Strain CCMP1244" /LENGTH=34 /DNA_ID= /DNA_START= /DNA_END= /DNA_ORIENTATION=
MTWRNASVSGGSKSNSFSIFGRLGRAHRHSLNSS